MSVPIDITKAMNPHKIIRKGTATYENSRLSTSVSPSPCLPHFMRSSTRAIEMAPSWRTSISPWDLPHRPGLEIGRSGCAFRPSRTRQLRWIIKVW
jgi:hypothetical protein